MPLIKSLKISWLSPTRIKELSQGEITNSKTFSPKKFKPELGGLFDPRIFGPFTSYECFCGKRWNRQNEGNKCPRCEVLITKENVQRWRRGHYLLAAPVTNIILFKNFSTDLSKVLDIPSKTLEEIIYLKSYVVIDAGSSKLLQKKQVLEKQVDPHLINDILQEVIKNRQLDEDIIHQAQQLAERLVEDTVFLEDYLTFLEKFCSIKIWTGSEAFQELLKGINLEKELAALKKFSGKVAQKNADKRRFLQALQDNKIRLEWMVMQNLPIIPCGLRPLIELKKEEKLTTTQLNESYRLAISADQGLRKCLAKSDFLPPNIIQSAKRRLQRSVDQLLYKSPYPESENVKSLAQNLSGKEGILRRYSLGKRVDYSARSVIVPNPELLFNQVGLPLKIVLGLFRPFILQKLHQTVYTSKFEQVLDQNNPLLLSLIGKIIQNHPVLINRAPSLHRLSIQGFYPKLAAGNSIELHPLVTTALNADFDGDQIAVHLPITKKAQEEVKTRILSSYHIVDPKNGHLIALPTQDMILGIYYLTKENKKPKKNYFDQLSSIWRSYEQGEISLNDLIVIPACLGGRNFNTTRNRFLFTTLGKLIFNQALPPSFPFYLSDLKEYNEKKNALEKIEKIKEVEMNEIEKEWKLYRPLGGWKKKDLIDFLNQLVRIVPHSEMVEFLEQLKKIGFDYATQSGISISPFELTDIIDKSSFFQKVQEEIKQIDHEYEEGYHNEEEDEQKRMTVWENYKENLKNQLINRLEKKTTTSFYQIWNSGARISTESLVQLFAMRGHATNYLGEIIQTPIVSSLWEGLTPPEFFISVYGTIKGMIDIALKTAEAGYLTRRLVESSQNVVILTTDCRTTQGIQLEEENELLLVPKCYGRYLSQAVTDHKKEVILKSNTLLLEKEIQLIQKHKITSLSVFSPLKCEIFEGLCQKCYGSDLTKPSEVIQIGTAVGIIAAQSLGEPGTQLTMRTFHAGKVSGEEDITQGLPKVKQIFDNLKPLKTNRAILVQEEGRVESVDLKNRLLVIKNIYGEQKNYSWEERKIVLVSLKELVEKGQTLTSGVVDLEEYLEVVGRDGCQNYIKTEIGKVYQSQGIEINDKHIEIFARQMLSRVKITDSGDSKYLLGEIVNYQLIQKENRTLISQGKKKLEFKNIVSSLKDLASHPSSFLAGISFQNTLKSLVNYSLHQPIDYLLGSKESLIAGQLIPVGTGFEKRKRAILKQMHVE
ncbi:MAG: DNA-directed RNA polymerase subunit beta' [Candidatus Moeniiplasma glomeromycotorum]|nr:DNA-directed RNA polymerase subunit beta' [Candidatus Moeniiplasma glomeromycotorum]MCE8167146.1 DNA-directed RNA polymerase subunit beta' [Candidatus Moeniiplasma glomeromycotorum]MCE8168842.1 DNA-directed RNA polymerase subunit beta' [Candidatus Moeniiplasma glomeromycotorum]